MCKDSAVIFLCPVCKILTDFPVLVFADIAIFTASSSQARVCFRKRTQHSTLGSHYQSIEADTIY